MFGKEVSMSAAAPLPLALVEWKPMPRNSLRGFASVRLGASLIIRDVTVHCSHGRRWAGMPGKPLLQADGSAKRGQNGKPTYVPVMEWASKEAADRFSDAVIAAIEREHPGATEGDYGQA
jgi:hypothetical protein